MNDAITPTPAGPPRRRRRVWLRAILLLLVIAAVGAAAAAFEVQRRLTSPYRGFQSEEVFVEIPPGTGVRAIGRRLAEAGVVRDEWTFRLATWRYGAGRALKAGEYRFAEPASPREVIGRLAAGDVVLIAVTFPEGLTIREMAAIFERRGLGPADAFVKAAGDPGAVGDLDPQATDLEGYLYPETYLLQRGATAADLVALMVRQFRRTFEPLWQARGDGYARTARETVTLASLVEKETSLPEERTTVAGVYANRLRIGMGLQCDPTVIYALMRAGRWDGNITRADLQFDSPYNTYRYAGLPPGPIASPGQGALAAALAPADVPYVYFVSRNDGSHVFSTTLDEHNRNVHRYQIQYFRDKRARERAAAGNGGR